MQRKKCLKTELYNKMTHTKNDLEKIAYQPEKNFRPINKTFFQKPF